MLNEHESACLSVQIELKDLSDPLFSCRLWPLQSCLSRSSHDASGLALVYVDKSMDLGISGILGESVYLHDCDGAAIATSCLNTQVTFVRPQVVVTGGPTQMDAFSS